MSTSNEDVFKKLIDSLNADLDFYAEMIREVSADMIVGNYTEYPIFIASQHEIKIGEKILDHLELARDFSIYATTMEVLIERRIIEQAYKSEFLKTYQDPAKTMCILFVRPDGANFVFRPYKKTKKQPDPSQNPAETF